MSLESRLIAFAKAVGDGMGYTDLTIGQLDQLATTDKSNLVAAINELNAKVATGGSSDGDTSVADLIASLGYFNESDYMNHFYDRYDVYYAMGL